MKTYYLMDSTIFSKAEDVVAALKSGKIVKNDDKRVDFMIKKHYGKDTLYVRDAFFGPVTIKYEPEECGSFTDVKWGVYLFDAEQNFRLSKSICPIGNLTPVLELHFDYMPFADEIWDKYGDQIYTELNKYLNIANK